MSEAHDNVVVFVDDDADLLSANIQTLELGGLSVRPFASAEAALKVLDERFPGVVVSDIRMPGMDGHQFHRRVRALDPDLPVILVTGHGDVAEAVRALHDGAYDFVTKPYPAEHLTAVINRALDKRRLVLENRRLQSLAEDGEADMSIIGETAAMQALRRRIRQLATADIDVLIEGETGAGKELAAHALHNEGPRQRRPFVVVDCAALDPTNAEIDLFGQEAGAGSVRKRVGKIEASDMGTLFLDEIEALPLSVQGKLLRVLEEREVTPLGAVEPRHLSLRIIASAKSDLAARVAAGDFRADLYYRLDVGRLQIPPLRARRMDALLLFNHFVQEASARLRRPPVQITTEIRERLLTADWPGNVRELRHFAIRIVLGVEDALEGKTQSENLSLAAKVDSYEAYLLGEALALCKGDVRTTTAMLQIPRKTFYEKLKRHGVDIDAFRV